jgi:hypothetical protein
MRPFGSLFFKEGIIKWFSLKKSLNLGGHQILLIAQAKNNIKKNKKLTLNYEGPNSHKGFFSSLGNLAATKLLFFVFRNLTTTKLFFKKTSQPPQVFFFFFHLET